MDFEWEDDALLACQEYFNKLPAEERIFMSHYDLAIQSGIGDAQLWKTYLTDKRVSDWIQSETQLFKDVQMRKLIKDATLNNRSAGAAQMLSALNKITETDDRKEGDIIIYSYVPPNPREEKAPNFTTTKRKDLFK